MAKSDVIPAEKGHIGHIAANMRLPDVKEIWASHRSTPERSLARALHESERAWTVMVDDMPAMMFGVAPRSIIFNTGTPWLLGTEDINKIGLRFAKHSRHYVDKMMEGYDQLSNAVHVENELSIKWLLWMGFNLKPAVPVGIDYELFYPFEMRSDYV